MRQINGYCLNDQQKADIGRLLKIPQNNEQAIFDDLEHRMNTDAWLVFDSDGKATAEKKSARIARDLNLLSQSLTKLGKTLAKIDPLVLGHLDDQFSFFYFEMSQGASNTADCTRSVLPLKKLISQTSEWASHTMSISNEDGGRGYFHRFFTEIEDFWYWNVTETAKLPNASFRKLIVILSNSDDDTVKKQLKRWAAKKSGDKTPK